MSKSYTGLKVLLVVFCLANVILGAAAFMGGGLAIRAASIFYGATFDLTPQLNHVIRMLGAFVFTLGVLGGLAALDPVKNKSIINGVILLLFLRILQRIVFARQILEAFGISYFRNLVNIAFFSAITLAFFFLRPKT